MVSTLEHLIDLPTGGVFTLLTLCGRKVAIFFIILIVVWVLVIFLQTHMKTQWLLSKHLPEAQPNSKEKQRLVPGDWCWVRGDL